MTYETVELSAQDGSPVRLYEFRRGQIYYRYTSAERDIVWDSKTWATVAGGIVDGGVSASGSSEQDRLAITAPWDLDVVDLYRGTPPSDPVTLTLRRLHLTDTDAEAAVVWVGVVTECSRSQPGKAELRCEAILYQLQKTGLRLAYGRSCPHILYDDNCRVVKSSFAVSATVGSLTTTEVVSSTFDSHPDGYFNGGFIEWDLDLLGTKERRPIDTHIGSTLTLLGLTDGMAVGLAVTAYPGCKRDVATCSGTFSNLANYGGFPHLPGKDPLAQGVLHGLTGGERRLGSGSGVTGPDGGRGGNRPPLDGGGVVQEDSGGEGPAGGNDSWNGG